MGDLIETLRERARNARREGNCTAECDARLYDEAAAALEAAREALDREAALKGGVEHQRDTLWAELEAAREDGWIACSDRLPERDGLGAVLAFDAARPRKGVWLETTHPSWWGQFMEDANEWGPTVTHWRPIPTPPAIDQARGIVPEAGQGVGT